MQPYSPKPGKRHNLFILAVRHFPGSLFATIIGIAFWGSPFLYNFFHDSGVHSIAGSVLLSVLIIGGIPLVVLYLVTLLRTKDIRKGIETEAEHQLEILYEDLEALHAKEKKDEKEVIRLEQVVKGDLKAKEVKDEKENERWDLLNESLRLQKETVELASEERLLVAQQVKDIKDEGEIIRKALVSDDLEARHVKDLKEDKRWDLLTESLRQQTETVKLASEERLVVAQQVKDVKDEREVMRIGLALDDLKARELKALKEDERWNILTESLRMQKETVELASEERILVAQQVKDIKDEGEVMRKGLVSDDLEARHAREDKDEKRWKDLHERLRIQEERSEEREKLQMVRDEEFLRMRHEDELKDKYKTLFARYVRNSDGSKLNKEVADGLMPIPEEWLKEQPEILKNPALLQLLQSYNER